MTKRLGFACPHCQAQSTGIKTKVLSELLMEVTYRCSRITCGHVFVANVEAVRTLSPSSFHRPEVQLPLSPHVRRRSLSEMLSSALDATANDVDDAARSRNRDLFMEVAPVG